MKLIILSLILAFTAADTFAQDSSTEPKKRCSVFKNSWIISSTPVSFLGLKEAPAKIISTADSELKDEAEGEIELRNLSDKTITAVKIKWFLFRVDRINESLTSSANSKVILERESSSIETGELKPDEKATIIYPLGQCQEIYDALVKDGDVKREPWIEPAVSEITYKDGSKWVRQ